MVTKSSSFVVLFLTTLGMITIIPPLNAQPNMVDDGGDDGGGDDGGGEE